MSHLFSRAALLLATALQPLSPWGTVPYCPEPKVSVHGLWRHPETHQWGDFGRDVGDRLHLGVLRARPVLSGGSIDVGVDCRGGGCRACLRDVKAQLGFRLEGLVILRALRSRPCLLREVKRHEVHHAAVYEESEARAIAWLHRSLRRLRTDHAGIVAARGRATAVAKLRADAERLLRLAYDSMVADAAWRNAVIDSDESYDIWAQRMRSLCPNETLPADA